MTVGAIGFAQNTGAAKGLNRNKNMAGLAAMGNGNSGGTGGAKGIHMTGYGFPMGKGPKMGQTSPVAPAMKKFMKDMSKSQGASGAASAAGAQNVQRPQMGIKK